MNWDQKQILVIDTSSFLHTVVVYLLLMYKSEEQFLVSIWLCEIFLNASTFAEELTVHVWVALRNY